MKTFEHRWHGEVFLLHLQLSRGAAATAAAAAHGAAVDHLHHGHAAQGPGGLPAAIQRHLEAHGLHAGAQAPAHAEETRRAPRLERTFRGGTMVDEAVRVPEGQETHRFIVSRSHPDEEAIRLVYPAEFTLEAFAIDDRAYYPTTAFFVG